jgi:MAM domain, meprin/A5/mu/SprB repeat/Secretion system C-terminal sorting domain/Putative metal-binding motif
MNPSGWEIELIRKGEVRTGVPTTPLITSKEYTFTGLTPSTAYEIYIRSVCSATSYSSWNVAIPFVTVISIPSACQINIPLKDNGTETFLLDVDEKGILGKDVFIDGIDLIVSHDWPADLKIILESPQGQQVTLSNHNGTVKDDFGDIHDKDCKRVTTFAPGACLGLKNGSPPYIGAFRPDGDMEMWRMDTLSKGFWKLIFFDRALKDIGILKYVNLRFNKEKCLLPEDLTILTNDVNTITVGWTPVASCNTVKITIQSDGSDIKTVFAECSDQLYTFRNLFPNTEYAVSIVGVCSDFSQSPESCFVFGATTCEPISMAENFDAASICQEGCGSVCSINSQIWYNPDNDDEQDWLVWKGKTDTENTGPSGDVNGTGNYIYIENNPLICTPGNQIVLQSKCVQVLSNASTCDMSFYYHMYGEDITHLSLEISTDNAQTWDELYHIASNQGDDWKRVTLSLSEYDNQIAIFRFRAQSSQSPLADIALDQIEFYRSIPVTDLSAYYPDADDDGYGVESGKILICNSTPPDGFSILKGDCNDNNPEINPASTEIQCNSADENCNGNIDDLPDFNPIFYTANKTDASCNGSKDGSIILELSGGTPPYSVSWNNGENGNNLSKLTEGVYFATITDAGGCMLRTSFFEIKSSTFLNIILSSSNQPSCKGKSDGFINIEHSAENPPFEYQWSNGNTSKNLSDIPDGTYTVTVTDHRNCSATLENIDMKASPTIVSDIKNIRHPLCSGSENGEIEIIVFNGIAPYAYQWNTGETTNKISNLATGAYTCTITDSAGCKDILATSIFTPPALEGNILSTESVRCFGESNGSIKTNVFGGKAPYTYLWNNFDFTDDIFNLSAGMYTLTITDSNGCRTTLPTVIINQPPVFEIMVDSISPASCILGKNGFVSLRTSGGNGGYNYAWNHTSESLPQFSNMASGNYSVTAYDKLGCKAGIPNIWIPFVNITVDVSLVSSKDNKCYLDNNAQIISEIENGAQPYDYNWSHGVQYFSNKPMDTISSLPAGLYKLTVTDKEGCTGVSNVILFTEKPVFKYTTEKVVNNICNTDSSGQIKLNISGGKNPIEIFWLDGLYTGIDIKNLPNGMYTGTITDAEGCLLNISSINLTSASDIKITTEIKNDENRTSSGEICVSISGGQAPYRFSWSNGAENTNCLTNLMAGVYQVTITDQLNCTVYKTFTVQNLSSTAEVNKQKIKLFPNPTGNYFNIISENPVPAVKIFDYKGLLVKCIAINSKSEMNDIDISDLPNGLYIIEAGNHPNTSYLKLIKI